MSRKLLNSQETCRNGNVPPVTSEGKDTNKIKLNKETFHITYESNNYDANSEKTESKKSREASLKFTLFPFSSGVLHLFSSRV